MNSIRFALLGIALVSISASASSSSDRYASQYARSIQGVLQNVLKNGSILASPSTANPNYYYDWVRDTSLTMKTVAILSRDPSLPLATRTALLAQIERWVRWETHRQQLQTLTGLGEPRFNVDGTPNNDPWGRPQNDGPALRALTAITIANQWIDDGRMKDVSLYLYRPELPASTLIKRDLEYVAHHWQDLSFDLWEEEQDLHFYTLTSQKVALQRGAAFAKRLGDPRAAEFYAETAKEIEQTLVQFIDPNRGIIRYSLRKKPGLSTKKSDLDIAVILAAIQTFDGRFQAPVSPLIQTMNAIADVFQKLYAVNQPAYRAKSALPLGVAIGRYPDDIYDGAGFGQGNPWFLATLALAEFTCDLKKAKALPAHENRALDEIALHQFNRVLFHLDQNGSMSEQYQRDNGYMRGARDLTWSYASYITAYRACFRP